jgi:hypothetical protein
MFARSLRSLLQAPQISKRFLCPNSEQRALTSCAALTQQQPCQSRALCSCGDDACFSSLGTRLTPGPGRLLIESSCRPSCRQLNAFCGPVINLDCLDRLDRPTTSATTATTPRQFRITNGSLTHSPTKLKPVDEIPANKCSHRLTFCQPSAEVPQNRVPKDSGASRRLGPSCAKAQRVGMEHAGQGYPLSFHCLLVNRDTAFHLETGNEAETGWRHSDCKICCYPHNHVCMMIEATLFTTTNTTN